MVQLHGASLWGEIDALANRVTELEKQSQRLNDIEGLANLISDMRDASSFTIARAVINYMKGV